MRRLRANHPTSHAAQRGFTLVEVLVALVVLSVGLLGLAAIQDEGLQYNHDAYLRSEATLLAQSMADRMRANMSAVDGTTDYYVITSMPAKPSYSCDSSNPCTAAQLAALDNYQWYTQAQNELPGGCSGLVGCKVCLDSNPNDSNPCDGVGNIYSIIVSWKAKDPQAASGFSTQESVMRFRP